MNAIEIRKLSKAFGATQALKEINLSVREGELFGLIGPDGAGKTTLIRILATLMLADSGEATVLGHEVVKQYRKIRKILGYMPGRFSLYYDLSVQENIELFATLFGTSLAENYDLVKGIYAQIEPFKHRKAGALSGGMKQKLALSCALIHRPEILFLDEPTTGVDAVSRREFWDMLDSLKAHGITMLVSTPYMDEASRCERVALMQEGQVMQVDTPENLIKAFPRPLWEVKAADTYGLLQTLRAFPSRHSVHAFGDAVHYTDQDPELDPAKMKAHLMEQGLSAVEIQPIRANIEDCFMALMEQQPLHQPM
ncbi:MAG: ABC transporter ATP-binding protein [Bacteroidota bacterium]